MDARNDRRALLRPDAQKVPIEFRSVVADCLRSGLRLPRDRSYQEAYNDLHDSGELRWRVHGSPDGANVLPFELNVHAPGGMNAKGLRMAKFRATIKYGELKTRGAGGLACVVRLDGDHDRWHLHPYLEAGGFVCETGPTERSNIVWLDNFRPSGPSEILAAALTLLTDWNFRDDEKLRARLAASGFPRGAVSLVV